MIINNKYAPILFLTLLSACGDTNNDNQEAETSVNNQDTSDNTGDDTSTDSNTDTDTDTDTDETTDDVSDSDNTFRFDNQACDYNYEAFNDDPSINTQSYAYWSCDESRRSLFTNSIPDHYVGRFPNGYNPNTITEQNVSIDMPLLPDVTDTQENTSIAQGVFGFVLNGISLQAGTNGGCDDNGDCVAVGANAGTDYKWSIEGLGQSTFDFGMDENNAHVRSSGEYHYHGLPLGFIERINPDESMTLLGFAEDGFPVYSQYGYSDATNASSAVKLMTTSYGLKTTPDEGRPSTEDFPMGTFYQDFEHIEDSGDLDACNGRVGVTPEFPEGIYHYYITQDFPRIPRCLVSTLN